MIVGVDLTHFDPLYRNGVGAYSKHLISALNAQRGEEFKFLLILPSNSERAQQIRNIFPNIQTAVLKSGQHIAYKGLEAFGKHFLRSHFIYNQVKHFRSKQLLDFVVQHNMDAVYTPTTYANFAWPIPSMVSLHDTQEKALPEYFSRRARLSRDFDARFTLSFSTKIQVSSEFIRSEIEKYFGNSFRARVVVINEGVKIAAFPQHQDRVGRSVTILFPANYWPHKGHMFLANELAMWNPEFNVRFILCGYPLENEPVLRNLFTSRSFNPRISIVYLGYLTDEELLFWYSNSDIVLSCSEYESSSLPLLEGLAAGCSVVASNIPAHIEMAQLLPIRLFDPREAGSLIKNIIEVLSVVQSGDIPLELNDKFDWAIVAQSFLKEFRNMRLK
jgi:glycosyltransferase involved in cell wall biosynthesis